MIQTRSVRELGYFPENHHLNHWHFIVTAQKLGKFDSLVHPKYAVRFAGSVDLDMDRSNAMWTKFQNQVLAAGMAGVAGGLVVPTINGDAQESQTAITCTNLVSGTSWQIAVDFDKGTVDSNRAKITEAQISWFDPRDGGNYTLDRKSGDLTASVASSTGGYFRHGRCSPEKLR